MILKRHINFITESFQKHEGTQDLKYDKKSNNYYLTDDIELKLSDTFNGKIKYNFKDSIDHTITASDIKLTSLEGFPTKYVYSLNIENNNLTSLKSCTKGIQETFDCSNNGLTSLEGGPESAADYYCHDNYLKNLIGAPKRCFNFDASDNMYLTSLEGCPEELDDLALINCTRLESLEYCPKNLGILNLEGSGIYSLQEIAEHNIRHIDIEKSKVTKLEHDFFIRVRNHKTTKESYYKEFVEYLNFNAESISNEELDQIILPEDVEESIKDYFRSAKGIKKFNI